MVFLSLCFCLSLWLCVWLVWAYVSGIMWLFVYLFYFCVFLPFLSCLCDWLFMPLFQALRGSVSVFPSVYFCLSLCACVSDCAFLCAWVCLVVCVWVFSLCVFVYLSPCLCFWLCCLPVSMTIWLCVYVLFSSKYFCIVLSLRACVSDFV